MGIPQSCWAEEGGVLWSVLAPLYYPKRSQSCQQKQESLSLSEEENQVKATQWQHVEFLRSFLQAFQLFYCY